MIEKVMNRPKILKIVDTQLLPLLEQYRKEQQPIEKRSLALTLLEFEDIFEYHYPEDYKECKEYTDKFDHRLDP